MQRCFERDDAGQGHEVYESEEFSRHIIVTFGNGQCQFLWITSGPPESGSTKYEHVQKLREWYRVIFPFVAEDVGYEETEVIEHSIRAYAWAMWQEHGLVGCRHAQGMNWLWREEIQTPRVISMALNSFQNLWLENAKDAGDNIDHPFSSIPEIKATGC
ncbi:hypothetical protein K438DRAFT_1781351 [Mycena galopus ATCC 62051]|nr:hypothetical protein K438DRAFT_1781351 [Mycena galopus ATCC 62051]